MAQPSESHSGSPYSVRLLSRSDQRDTETSTRQHAIIITERYPCPRRNSNPQSRQASGRRSTP